MNPSDSESEPGAPGLCPQCSFSADVAAVWTHMHSAHGIDARTMPFMERVMLVNFLRAGGKLEGWKAAREEKEKWLKPVLQDDPMLYEDTTGNDDDDEAEGKDDAWSRNVLADNSKWIDAVGGTDVDSLDVNAARERIRTLEAILSRSRELTNTLLVRDGGAGGSTVHARHVAGDGSESDSGYEDYDDDEDEEEDGKAKKMDVDNNDEERGRKRADKGAEKPQEKKSSGKKKSKSKSKGKSKRGNGDGGNNSGDSAGDGEESEISYFSDEEENRQLRSYQEARIAHARAEMQRLRANAANAGPAAPGAGGAPNTGPVDKSVFLHNGTDDKYYFDSYSRYEIHEEMLKDDTRTYSYQQAIYQNRDAFRGKVVLDIGCGTGILSMFAARAGAARVIGMDLSDIIDTAEEIVRLNGLSNVITLVKGRVEDVTELPHGIKQVDIIISEWMGYCLIYESMLNTVLYARDRWLNKESGIILPDISIMKGFLLRKDFNFYNDKFNFWNEVYDFKMAPMKALVDRQIKQQIKKVDISVISSDFVARPFQPQTLNVFNINTMTGDDLDFDKTMTFRIENPRETVEAVLVYFDILFLNGKFTDRAHPERTDELMRGMNEFYSYYHLETFSAPNGPHSNNNNNNQRGNGRNNHNNNNNNGNNNNYNDGNNNYSYNQSYSYQNYTGQRPHPTQNVPQNYVWFSTGPHYPATHWKQAVFYLPQHLNLVRGDEVTFEMLFKRRKKNFRSYKVRVHVIVKRKDAVAEKHTYYYKL